MKPVVIVNQLVGSTGLIIKRKVVKEVLATTFMMVYKYHCKH
jgi:hypothetical protein